MTARRPHYTAADVDGQLAHIADALPSSSSHEGLEHLAPIIRNAVHSRQHDLFLKNLADLVKRKDDEIETVCKANYQVSGRPASPYERPLSDDKDFITSTDKLLNVRQGTVSLKHRVLELNADIQSKGGSLAAKVHSESDLARSH
jgi:hypothetical protein